MEKYRLVQEHKADGSEEFLDSPTGSSSASGYPEIRITQQGKPRNYITYAMNRFVRGARVQKGSLAHIYTYTQQQQQLTYSHTHIPIYLFTASRRLVRNCSHGHGPRH
jgi:hypothetical protein